MSGISTESLLHSFQELSREQEELLALIQSSLHQRRALFEKQNEVIEELLRRGVSGQVMEAVCASIQKEKQLLTAPSLGSLLSSLGFSRMIVDCLYHEEKVATLRDLIAVGEEKLSRSGVGEKSLQEIKQKLESWGLSLAP